MAIGVAYALSAPINYLFIEVSPTKPNGKSWDIFGGAPDIQLRIDRTLISFQSKCQDIYRCEIKLPYPIETGSKHYIEIYDKDIEASDLIGKKELEIIKDKTIQIGNATIRFEYTPQRITLADSHVDLPKRLRYHLDSINKKVTITIADLQALKDIIIEIKRYHIILEPSLRKDIETILDKASQIQDAKVQEHIKQIRMLLSSRNTLA
jgi:hypothetical protein